MPTGIKCRQPIEGGTARHVQKRFSILPNTANYKSWKYWLGQQGRFAADCTNLHCFLSLVRKENPLFGKREFSLYSHFWEFKPLKHNQICVILEHLIRLNHRQNLNSPQPIQALNLR